MSHVSPHFSGRAHDSRPRREAHGGHSHAPATCGRIFLLGIGLNGLYILLELWWGLVSGSLGLVSDAAHNLSDTLALASTWLAYALARKAPTRRFTYGLKRSTILAALLNSILLLLVTGGIIWESVLRIFAPISLPGMQISLVALTGMILNGITALLFMRGSENDLNIRAAFLHMAGDALLAGGVVAAGLAIYFTGAGIIDPILSLLISLYIVYASWKVLSRAAGLALDAVPEGIATDRVTDALLALPGISGVHHLHIWPMSTTETALTVHIIADAPADTDQLMAAAGRILKDDFGIAHATFQIEKNSILCRKDGAIADDPGALFESSDA